MGNTPAALLAVGANPEIASHDGWTPLLLSTQENDAAILSQLLEAGADPNATTAEGDTAASLAAGYGSLECARLLSAARF